MPDLFGEYVGKLAHQYLVPDAGHFIPCHHLHGVVVLQPLLLLVMGKPAGDDYAGQGQHRDLQGGILGPQGCLQSYRK